MHGLRMAKGRCETGLQQATGKAAERRLDADILRCRSHVRFTPESGHCGQLSRERSSAILRTNAAKKATEKADPKTSAVVVAIVPVVCPFQMSATAPVNIVSGRQTTITTPRITITFSRDTNLLAMG
jgi:hypothetical protein